MPTAGSTVGTWADGRQQVRPLPLDPIPRLLPADEWAALAAGVEQRHRALNAFLAEAYRAAGRRRDDADRAPQVVRAGVLPEWAVAHSPGRDPDAVGQAWPGQPRATVAGIDVLRTADGSWVVTKDNLRVPAGLGYALANRESLRAALPSLFAELRPVDPFAAVPLLRAGLEAAAPPGISGTPRIAVLTSGESDNAWFEHRLLADALGVPLVRAADLWPRLDGGVEVSVGGERLPVDVLYRRFDDGLLGAFRVPIGSPLESLLTEAVRAGRLGLANVPGNGLADDVAAYAWVPAMIRFYLGEEPLLGLRAARGCWPTRSSGRRCATGCTSWWSSRSPGTAGGARCSARPARRPSWRHCRRRSRRRRTASSRRSRWSRRPSPTLVDGALVPRHVDLRVFSVAGAAGRDARPPCPADPGGAGRGPEPDGRRHQGHLARRLTDETTARPRGLTWRRHTRSGGSRIVTGA